MSKVQAIFFDLYETVITEFDPDWKPEPTTAERLGIGAEAYAAEWRGRNRERMTGRCSDYRAVLREICYALDAPADEDLIQQLHNERLNAKAVPFARIEQEVIDALTQIKALGIKIGLISNCTAEEVAALRTSNLYPLFDDVVLSYEVGYAKPDLEIYQLACHRLEVKPERALFVGDGGSDELMGATRAGMTAYKANWFLASWPAWKRSKDMVEYPVLEMPSELLDVIR